MVDHDDKILDHFIDLDEELDVNISCDSLTLDITIKNDPHNLDYVLSKIYSRIEKIRSMGEYQTNPVWNTWSTRNQYGQAYFKTSKVMDIPKIYNFSISDDELKDMNLFLDRSRTSMLEHVVKNSNWSTDQIRQLRKLTHTLKINDIQITKIEINFKPIKYEN